jgi:arabinogalactan endo-1,4-beta-galactosidase
VKDVIKAFISRDIMLVRVQFGNEIPSGMLWPDGMVGGSYDTEEQCWWQLGELFKYARQGLEWAYWGKTLPKVVVHLDHGGNKELHRWFFNNLMAQGVEFDVTGVSFIPWWHGKLLELKANLEFCVQEFVKDIVLAEISYPWTLQLYDWENNVVGLTREAATRRVPSDPGWTSRVAPRHDNYCSGAPKQLQARSHVLGCDLGHKKWLQITLGKPGAF